MSRIPLHVTALLFLLTARSAPAAAASDPAPVPAPPPASSLPLPGEKEFAECQRIPEGRKVVITLKPNSELPDLVGWIKSISCRPFLYAPALVRGGVTIVVPEAVPPRVAYRVFLSALEALGLTVQPDGQVLRIIESSRAREGAAAVLSPGQAPPAGPRFVTRLLKLQHATPDEVLPVLTKLKGRDGDITPYGPGGLLVITDQGDNVRRLEQVARSVDVPLGGERLWWIPLQRVAATEAAQLLQQLSQAGKGQGQKGPERGALSLGQVVAEERAGAVILVAGEAAYRQALGLIERLEQQAAQLKDDGDRTHVYPLQNAVAEEVAAVLQGLGAAASSGSAPARRPAGASGAPGAAPASGASQAGRMFQDEVHVAFDKATNLLILSASPRDYAALRGILRHLDVPRRQVFIEATVMEVSLSDSKDLGLSYHGGGNAGGGLAFGNFGNGDLLASGAADAAKALAGLSGASFFGPAFNLASIGLSGQIPSFGIVLHALQQSGAVNVLQNPSLLTLDNEKASLLVGKTVPFPVSSFGVPGSAPGGGAAFGTSYQRQDVALKLEITPHVSAGDLVRLEIENEISQLGAQAEGGGGPVTDKRQLKTSAVVRDQEPVVLGGILQDVTRETVSKIPVLGDIPLLGALFRNKSKHVEKQALLIVMTPYIINDPADLRRIRERKEREREDILSQVAFFRTGQTTPGRAIDYAKKRGALVEMLRTSLETEREAALQAAAAKKAAPASAPGPIEPVTDGEVKATPGGAAPAS